MKVCKYCGEPGIVDSIGREYFICRKCHGKKISKSMMGHITTIETKMKISIGNSGKIRSDGTKEKYRQNRLGKKTSKETRKKMSDRRSGKNHYNYGKKLSEETKIKKSIAMTGFKATEETKQKQRISTIKFIEQKRLNGEPLCPRVGKDETYILNNIEKENNIKLERQYRVIGYFLDGYDKENNTVYEVDEKYHMSTNQQKKDIIRKENIINHLQCGWICIEAF